MLRVTPDVNLLVEGTISSRGPAAAILSAWEAGDVALVVCEEIIAEYRDVLDRPRIRTHYAHLTPDVIAAAVRALRYYAVLIPLGEVAPVIHDDPDDDVVLACAVAGGAEYVVSRDHHLLRQAQHRDIRIVSAEEFLTVLRQHLAAREGS